MFRGISDSLCVKMMEAAAYFPDTHEVRSPRKVIQEWDGSPKGLDSEIPEVSEVVQRLAMPEVFDALDLDQVDGIMIEDESRPLIHFKKKKNVCIHPFQSNAKATLTIDLSDLRAIRHFVETMEMNTDGDGVRGWFRGFRGFRGWKGWSLLGVGTVVLAYLVRSSSSKQHHL